MKILLVSSYYYPNIVGGAEISTQKLAEGLFQCGHEVIVLCSDNYEKEEIIRGVRVIRIKNALHKGKLISTIEQFLWSRWNIFLSKRIYEILQRVSPDVIHSNSLYMLSPIVWKCAEELNIPVVHTLRDYHLYPQSHIMKMLYKQMSQKVSIVTSPSYFTLKFFCKKGYFKQAVEKKRIVNAIDEPVGIDKIFSEKMFHKQQHVNFAYLGRYTEEKGLLWLVNVFEKMSHLDCSLYLFGHGPLEEDIKDRILTSKNIINKGFLKEEELYEELKIIDVIIIPSLWEEPFGRVILDAYVNAIPVIVTRMGGMPEFVKEGKTGFIVEPGNDLELIRALSYFVNNNQKWPRMLTSIKPYLKNFYVSKQVKDFESMYYLALKKR